MRTLPELRACVEGKLADFGGKGPLSTSLPGLLLLRNKECSGFQAMLYEPVVCLILQGGKETTIGGRTLQLGPGQSLIVSHNLPVSSRVTSASAKEPYLALVLTLDLAILRGLYNEIADREAYEVAHSMDVHEADGPVIDALARYVDLLNDPIEAKVMGPLIRKEIHFRLLMAPHGAMLRRLLSHNSHASCIARAIDRIRRDFRETLATTELAKTAGMSSSSFHKHFKSVTQTTPLQYQKELRLLEARRLLIETGSSVSDAAFEVGYESPTQFSREYARKFGASPRNDISAQAG